MQFNSMRILVVLGLSVSLRVVKNGRWKEEIVTNSEIDGFSGQPANESPTRDPSNCADPKLPVTHIFFILIFQMCPRKFLSKLPAQWNCWHLTFKNVS